MPFTHDTIDALRGAAALVNTAGAGAEAGPGSAGDSLRDPDDLAAFLTEWTWTGRVVGDAAELEQVRALRPRLRQAWLAESDEDLVAIVNELLRTGRARPQVVDHDGYGWHVHATDAEAPLAQRMQVEAAMALVDVIRAGERCRLLVCAADDCADVVVDLSRNRSKRYCEKGCGNRLAAAAYRSRQTG